MGGSVPTGFALTQTGNGNAAHKRLIMTIYRLSLPTLAFSLFAIAASAATSNDVGASHPSMGDHQAVAASMPQVPQTNNAPPRVVVTVAPPAQAAPSSLLTPQNSWWKDR